MTSKVHNSKINQARPAKTVKRVGPGRPTKQQIEERNRQLLDHALDHFLEKGFEGTTIRDITASVGMAKRTIASRYGDKVSLFKAALERAIDDWIVPVERLQEMETDDLEETLLGIGRILARNMLSPAGLRLLRITNTESHRMPEIGAYTHEHGTRPTITYLADLFRRRLSQGRGFPDAERYAMSFLNLVVGSPARTTAWGIQIDEIEAEARIRHCVHLFLHGLLNR
ncbi:MAG: TetR/AcrR family transcriptional regulator [Hyphomicrobiales bacterium]|nr:TetR/AcrR family transcriptional regulator [Hyphomicrobiales bacterium]